MTKALHGKTQDLSDQVVKVMPNSEFEDCMIQLREIEAKILQEPYSGTAVDLISQYRELILVSIVCITQLNRKLALHNVEKIRGAKDRKWWSKAGQRNGSTDCRSSTSRGLYRSAGETV